MKTYTITALEPQKSNKNKFNLFLDGEFYAGITHQSVVFCGLKIGKTITEVELKNLLNSTEVQVAFDKSLNLLSHGMKTEKQIKDYLINKGFEQRVVDIVLQKLKGYNYVDDMSYAKAYVEQNKKTKGAFRIKQELYLKGICDEIIQEALLNLSQDETIKNALVVAKKFVKDAQLDEKTKTRLTRHLLSRGFSFGVVNSVLSELKANDLNNDEYVEFE